MLDAYRTFIQKDITSFVTKDALVTSDEIPIISIKASERFLNGLHPYF